jgi:hypothetical protein
MERIKSISKAALLSGVLLLLILASLHPTLTLAAKYNGNGSGLTNSASGQTSSNSSSSSGSSSGDSSGQSSNTTGPNQPTGPSADTFTYDPTTGLWENAYYSWNPVTGQTEPLTPQTYSYNPATGMWDTTQWVFDAATGQYVPNVVTVTQPPAGATTVNSPTTDTDNSSDTSGSSTTANTPDATGDSTTTNTPDANTATGPSSTNNSNTNNNSNDFFGLFYNANISNGINENAQSGDATVSGNTLAGDATSGNVQDVANVINLLQSSAAGISTFVANINGNVAGNLLLDPSTIIQPTSDPQQTSSNTTNTNTTTQVNSANNSTINNNVNLNANSGNADVTNNTSAGNATTGSADAVANIINLIDSDIASGQSFLGVINIYGDLDGNILLPPNFLNTLLASNAASDPVSTSNGTTTTTVDNSNNDAINNSITNTANSGTASVNQNSSAGNATSGNASNNITILNLTGSQIIGSNDLLVFVNVLGTWVGVIMDAPAGATAAELGGGITSNTTSANTTSTLNSTNNNTINNTVNDNASSGNATVADNTTAGNATSGNASASVNLLNLIDSQLSVSNWFGILFINVFGTWDGSLGEETIPVVATTTTNTPPPSTSASTNNSYAVIFSKSDPSTDGDSSLASAILADANSNNSGGTYSFSKNILVSAKSNIIGSNTNAKSHKSTSSLSIMALAIGFASLILLGIERVWSNNKKRAKADIS